MGNLPQIGPEEEAIEAGEILPPPAPNQVLNSEVQINEENSKHEYDDMENGESDQSDDQNSDDSGDESDEEALAERRRIRYGMIFNFLAKNKTHEELVVIQQKLQQQCPQLAQ